MKNKTYSIAILRVHAGRPWDKLNLVDWRRDELGDIAVYNLQAAKDELADLHNCVYWTSHGEMGRPEYIILEAADADYLSSGRNMDMGNYDWDDCACQHADEAGDPCGECNNCIGCMANQDRDYVRDNAVVTAGQRRP